MDVFYDAFCYIMGLFSYCGMALKITFHLLMVCSPFIPFFILSISLLKKGKPVAGLGLAVVKVLFLSRLSFWWMDALRSSGASGWEWLGFGYSPFLAVVQIIVYAIGAACIILNVWIFIKQRIAGKTPAQT